MWEVVVRRDGQWHLVGQYASQKQARVIARDYRSRGEQALARRQK